MKNILYISCLFLLCLGCSESATSSKNAEDAYSICSPATISYDASQLFPGPGYLRRPEDGRQLPDGRIVVADEYSGMWLIEENGSGRLFGRFAEAGYLNDPPNYHSGPNGMYLEQDGLHLLLADIYTGKIVNWQAVGGKDAPITVVNKSAGHSTLELFLHHFGLENTDVKPHVIIGDNQQGITGLCRIDSSL